VSDPAENHADAPAETDHDREATIDQIIADCDGDLRAAIRALVIANNFLEQQLGEILACVSKGFVRGRYDDISAP
jgi:hypothetical protein